jgi:hypothetical protein
MMSPIIAMQRARGGLLNSKKMGNSERKTLREVNAGKMRKFDLNKTSGFKGLAV